MLRLRPYKKCDAEQIVKWINDEVSFRKWSASTYENYPITADDINRLYESFAFSDAYYEMTAFDETGAAGHLIMRFTDEEKTILRFGLIIVNNDKRGKGYGKEMLRLALQYAFDILKVTKVTLGVFENNAPAYRCYKSVGFKDTDREKYFHILGEDWKCLELEVSR